MNNLAVCGMLLVVSVGCGRQHDDWNRAAVRGRVTLDGAPLGEATITFFPVGVKGPAAGGPIRDGQYEIDERDGPVVGSQRVEIRSVQKTGRTVHSPIAPEGDGPVVEGQLVEERIEVVPPDYNRRSTLVRDIRPGGNELDFELTRGKQ